MTNGAIQRVPASSPKVGMWQPLERYVVNLCAEALSPMSSITQVEINIRELRLYARKDASNELPLSRNTDLYALFRALTIPNIITLFEYVLSESRIILYSSHASMLHLVSAGHCIVDISDEMVWRLHSRPAKPPDPGGRGSVPVHSGQSRSGTRTLSFRTTTSCLSIWTRTSSRALDGQLCYRDSSAESSCRCCKSQPSTTTAAEYRQDRQPMPKKPTLMMASRLSIHPSTATGRRRLNSQPSSPSALRNLAL